MIGAFAADVLKAPPHAAQTANAPTATSPSKSRRRRIPIRVAPNIGIHIDSAIPCHLCNDASDLLAEIVNIVDAVFAPGVTVLGDKLHVLPVGNPEQVIWIALLNAPPCGVTFRFSDADCPAFTCTVADDSAWMLKS